MVLSALIAASLVATPETWVVVSRRTGATGPKSLEVAGAVAKALSNAGVPTTLSPEDLSTCAGKKPCLVEKGKAKGVPAMVLLDVGVVLGEGVAKLEVISVDEFGKKVAVTDAEGKADAIGGALVAKVPALVGPLKELLGIKEPAPVTTTKVEPPKKDEPRKDPPPPEKVAAADLPPPPPPPSVEVERAADGPTFFTTSRIVGLAAAGVGAGVAVVGAVFLGQAAAASRTIDMLCPMRVGCSNAEAFAAWERGRPAQNTGVAFLVGGGLAAAGGLALFLLNPGGAPAEPTPSVSFFVTPAGGQASVTIQLP
jgi:hypothetical protein